jgi:phosphoenolpyruvate carboxylase
VKPFARLVAAGTAADDLFASICKLRLELVLTAHPTEVSRRTLIHKYNRVAELLAERDHVDLTIPERDAVLDALRREIVSAWETDEVRHDRPSPLDEVRGGLIVFEQSLWQAVPAFLRSVDTALRQVAARGLPLDVAPLRFGSWIGGDRDGNPNVTPEVTRKACLLSRWQAADLYLPEINALREELSMSHASRTSSNEPAARMNRIAYCCAKCAIVWWRRASGLKSRFGKTVAQAVKATRTIFTWRPKRSPSRCASVTARSWRPAMR